jgi:hypothetical protein
MRARAATGSLGPVPYADDTPISRLTESILEDVRAPRGDEPPELLFLIAFKRTLNVESCRALLRAGGADLELMDRTFARID